MHDCGVIVEAYFAEAIMLNVKLNFIIDVGLLPVRYDM